MFLYGLLPIMISMIAFIMRDRLLDYTEKMNVINKIPISREILSKRLFIVTIFLFIVGIYGLLKSV